MKMEMKDGDEQRLNELFQQLAELVDFPVEDLLRKEGRLLAVDFAEGTLPRGKSVALGVKYKEKIEKKIRYIYSKPSIFLKIVSAEKGYHAGERFKNHCQRRRTAEAEALLQAAGLGTYKGRRVRVIMFDGGRRHKANLKSAAKLSEIYVVCDFKAVDAYVVEQQARAGDLKSGWARVAEQLGGARGIPAWAKGKGKKIKHTTKGKGSVTGSKANKILFLSNKTAKSLSPKDAGFAGLRMRVEKLEKRIKRMIRAELKKRL